MEAGNGLRIDVERVYERHPFAKVILEKLSEAGHEAVLIGGVVRDALRARFEPDYDFQPEEIDIATSAHPDDIKQAFAGYRVLEVGQAFGVLVIVSPEGETYEIATYRVEDEYDGRWPGRVELVRDLERDLQRRDFTVNGLAAHSDGRVIDLVGGVVDLQRRVIRTIGAPEERFREDHLRMLRAIRFACALDARLTPETSAAIRAHRQRLQEISQERVRDEFIAILRTAWSHQGIRLLDEHGLLELILPELTRCKGVEQPEAYHPEGDVFVHTLLALKAADRFIKDPIVKLAVLLHDVGKPEALVKNRGENAAGHDNIGAQMARAICRRLRLSNEESQLVTYLVREHQRIGHFPEMGRGKQVKFLKEGEDPSHGVEDVPARYPSFGKLVQLMIADCQASAMRSRGWLPVLQATSRLLVHLEALERRTRARKLIDGHDLIKMGVPEGPELGVLLEELYDRIYAGEITSREEALAQANAIIQERDPARM